MMSIDRRLEVAVESVTSAAMAARAVQQDLDRIVALTKNDRSPVSVADFAVQAIVAIALQRNEQARIVGEESLDELAAPENALMREAVVECVRLIEPDADENAVLRAIESCDHDGTSASYWTLDPVDGTKGFLRGQQYAISLAWIEHGRVTLGVLGCPNLSIDQSEPTDAADPHGTVYVASLGGGAWERRLDDDDGAMRRLRYLPRDPSDPIRSCESVESGHSSHDDAAKVLASLGRVVEPVRLDSQCKYALVARGQADAYLRMPTGKGYIEKIWDHAAGMAVAVEAGAMVTDIHGKHLDFTHGRRLEHNRGIVCADPEVHPRLIKAIAERGI